MVTIADYAGAQATGVRFSAGADPSTARAVHALKDIGELIEAGRFTLTVAQTFPLDQIAEAHRLSETGHVRGKLGLLVELTPGARSTGRVGCGDQALSSGPLNGERRSTRQPGPGSEQTPDPTTPASSGRRRTHNFRYARATPATTSTAPTPFPDCRPGGTRGSFCSPRRAGRPSDGYPRMAVRPAKRECFGRLVGVSA